MGSANGLGPFLVTTPVDKDGLTDAAWAMVHDAMVEGSIKLPTGEVREVNTRELLALIKWLASLSAIRKKKRVSTPDEFLKTLGIKADRDVPE